MARPKSYRHLSIEHERFIKAAQPRLVVDRFHKVIDRNDGVFIDQREGVG